MNHTWPLALALVGAACARADLVTPADAVDCRAAPASCDDGLACTLDRCGDDGACVHDVDPAHCDDADPCTTDLCDALGVCQHVVDDACGGCVDSDCNDGNPCTGDACATTGGCSHVELTIACDDGDPLSLADRCQSGACGGLPDLDADQVADAGYAARCADAVTAGCNDNCAGTANPSQADGDGDLAGDLCDNCLSLANPTQVDPEADGVGSACDNCPDDGNPLQTNTDGDLFGDACDNCPAVANDDQTNLDADPFGDACDTDGPYFSTSLSHAGPVQTNDSTNWTVFAEISVTVDGRAGMVYATVELQASGTGTLPLGTYSSELTAFDPLGAQLDQHRISRSPVWASFTDDLQLPLTRGSFQVRGNNELVLTFDTDSLHGRTADETLTCGLGSLELTDTIVKVETPQP